MSDVKGKKRKHFSNHIDAARICVDNINDLSAIGIELIFKIAQISDRNNVIRDDDGYTIQSISDIARTLGVSMGTAFKELNSKGVIKKIKYGREKAYVLNPYIIHKDSSVIPEIYVEFKDSQYRYVYGEDYFEEVLI